MYKNGNTEMIKSYLLLFDLCGCKIHTFDMVITCYLAGVTVYNSIGNYQTVCNNVFFGQILIWGWASGNLR